MRRFIAFLSCLLILHSSFLYAVGNGFSIISSGSVGSGKIMLYRQLDKSNSRRNPDGDIFYKTTYKVSVVDSGKTFDQVLESDLYTSEDLNWNGMWPSLLIDPENSIISIFANGKGPNENNYGMVGYAYRFDKCKKWERETIFSNGNFGWFSYFGGSQDGNPELWHFSYAGYRLLRSVRSSDGSWITTNIRGISPDQANADQRSKNKIVIGSTFGVQKPLVNTSSDATGAIIGAAIAGAAVIGVVKWLLSPLSESGSTVHANSSSGSKRVQCNYCSGTGSIVCTSCKGTGVFQDWTAGPQTCSSCKGTGRQKCPVCNGTGYKVEN